MSKKILTSSSTHAQLIRYFFVAFVGLVVDFGTVIFTKEVLEFHYLLAAVTGFVFGLAVTFTLSNRFVFGVPRGSQKKAFFLFGLIGLVGLLILSGLMFIMTGLIGLNYIISKTLATGVVFVWNFIARRTLYDPQEIKLPYEL